MKFFITTLGCHFSQYDTWRVKTILGSLHHTETANATDADLVILNTCAVQERSEHQALEMLQEICNLIKDETRVGIIGCMIPETSTVLPVKAPQNIRSILQPDFVISARDFSKLEKILPRLFPHASVMNETENEAVPTPLYTSIPVSQGCSEFCTYCIVPYRRGPQHFIEPEKVVSEVGTFAENGTKVVTLLGQNLLRYGHNLNKLVESISAIPGIKRIYLSSFHPRYFTKAAAGLFDLKKVCPYVRIPVQSGCNDILRRMGRNYTVEEFVSIVQTLRHRFPGIAISTDFIVGFPGESESQFEESVILAQKLSLDGARVATYSPRPGTAALRKYDDNIALEIKNRRKAIIDSIIEKSVLQNNRELIGKTVQILCETATPRESIGRTGTAKKVSIENTCLNPGGFYRACITRASPWCLYGRIIYMLPYRELYPP